jgi:ATP/maltotriose-dependent transcriptional regulator MalT
VALYKRFLETSGEEWLSRTIETVMERDDATRVTVETVVFRITTNRGPVYASFSRDVTELHRTRNQLMARERELVERNELLQQKNIALREVLSQLEREKKRLGDQVQINADRFVIPLVEQLRSVAPAGLHQYLDAIKDNLGELTLPFGQSISRPLLRLSKREIEVCNAIRQGMSCKEVADLMSISVRTVETHRNRIRRKLGIVDPAVNLTTYLQSLGGD